MMLGARASGARVGRRASSSGACVGRRASSSGASASVGRLLRVSDSEASACTEATLASVGCRLVQIEAHREDGLLFERAVFVAADGTPVCDAVARRAAEAFAPAATATARATAFARGGGRRRRLAVFVGRRGHALREVLERQASGSLACDVACVVSNHEALRGGVERRGIPFHRFDARSPGVSSSPARGARRRGAAFGPFAARSARTRRRRTRRSSTS